MTIWIFRAAISPVDLFIPHCRDRRSLREAKPYANRILLVGLSQYICYAAAGTAYPGRDMARTGASVRCDKGKPVVRRGRKTYGPL